MTTIRLLTRSGDLVTEVTSPPFNPPAEVINWGLRFFVRQSDGEYREGMVWVAMDGPSVDTRPPSPAAL